MKVNQVGVTNFVQLVEGFALTEVLTLVVNKTVSDVILRLQERSVSFSDEIDTSSLIWTA